MNTNKEIADEIRRLRKVQEDVCEAYRLNFNKDNVSNYGVAVGKCIAFNETLAILEEVE